MSSHVNAMPIDKSKIKTKLNIDPYFLTDPKSFIRGRNIEIRNIRSSKTATSMRLTFDLLTYGGINVFLIAHPDSQPIDATITFNPGVALYGHNGRSISLDEFVDALDLLSTSLLPFLIDPDNALDIVPGLRKAGPAFWSYLEVSLQRPDPDGTLLAGFRHLSHPSIRSATRHWSNSIRAGDKRGELQLAIYRKALELEKRCKLPTNQVADYADILRLELRARGKKLAGYFGNDRNVETIDGTARLVKFYPTDIVRGHRKCFGDLEGVFANDDTKVHTGDIKPLDALGLLLARVALDQQYGHTFPQLCAILKHYTKTTAKSNANTMGRIQRAGMAQLSRHSQMLRASLLSDSAFNEFLGVGIAELEQLTRRSFDSGSHRSAILKAYRPPGQPLSTTLGIPSYHQ